MCEKIMIVSLLALFIVFIIIYLDSMKKKTMKLNKELDDCKWEIMRLNFLLNRKEYGCKNKVKKINKINKPIPELQDQKHFNYEND